MRNELLLLTFLLVCHLVAGVDFRAHVGTHLRRPDPLPSPDAPPASPAAAPTDVPTDAAKPSDASVKPGDATAAPAAAAASDSVKEKSPTDATKKADGDAAPVAGGDKKDETKPGNAGAVDADKKTDKKSEEPAGKQKDDAAPAEKKDKAKAIGDAASDPSPASSDKKGSKKAGGEKKGPKGSKSSKGSKVGKTDKKDKLGDGTVKKKLDSAAANATAAGNVPAAANASTAADSALKASKDKSKDKKADGKAADDAKKDQLESKKAKKDKKGKDKKAGTKGKKGAQKKDKTRKSSSGRRRLILRRKQLCADQRLAFRPFPPLPSGGRLSFEVEVGLINPRTQKVDEWNIVDTLREGPNYLVELPRKPKQPVLPGEYKIRMRPKRTRKMTAAVPKLLRLEEHVADAKAAKAKAAAALAAAGTSASASASTGSTALPASATASVGNVTATATAGQPALVPAPAPAPGAPTAAAKPANATAPTPANSTALAAPAANATAPAPARSPGAPGAPALPLAPQQEPEDPRLVESPAEEKQRLQADEKHEKKVKSQEEGKKPKRKRKVRLSQPILPRIVSVLGYQIPTSAIEMLPEKPINIRKKLPRDILDPLSWEEYEYTMASVVQSLHYSVAAEVETNKRITDFIREGLKAVRTCFDFDVQNRVTMGLWFCLSATPGGITFAGSEPKDTSDRPEWNTYSPTMLPNQRVGGYGSNVTAEQWKNIFFATKDYKGDVSIGRCSGKNYSSPEVATFFNLFSMYRAKPNPCGDPKLFRAVLYLPSPMDDCTSTWFQTLSRRDEPSDPLENTPVLTASATGPTQDFSWLRILAPEQTMTPRVGRERYPLLASKVPKNGTLTGPRDVMEKLFTDSVASVSTDIVGGLL